MLLKYALKNAFRELFNMKISLKAVKNSVPLCLEAVFPLSFRKAM